jgi:2-methylaconitate isomerase
VPGTLVAEAIEGAAGGRAERLRIGHPLGVMQVVNEVLPGAGAGGVAFQRLGFGRTARRLMHGEAYVPASAVQGQAA